MVSAEDQARIDELTSKLSSKYSGPKARKELNILLKQLKRNDQISKSEYQELIPAARSPAQVRKREQDKNAAFVEELNIARAKAAEQAKTLKTGDVIVLKQGNKQYNAVVDTFPGSSREVLIGFRNVSKQEQEQKARDAAIQESRAFLTVPEKKSENKGIFQIFPQGKAPKEAIVEQLQLRQGLPRFAAIADLTGETLNIQEPPYRVAQVKEQN